MSQPQTISLPSQTSHPRPKEKLIPFPKYRCFLQSKYLCRKLVSLYKKKRPKYRKLEYIEHNDSLKLLAGTCLKKALQVIKSHHPLIALDLQFARCPHITDQCLFKISHYIRKLPLLHSLTLNFSQCERITDQTLEHLKKSFQKLVYLQSLSLDFSDCTKITNKGLKSLSQGVKHLVSLKSLHLDLSDCVEIEDQGLQHLGDSFKSLGRLVSLKLTAQRLTSLSGELFGSFCKNFGRLKSLLIANFDFGGSACVVDESLKDFSLGIANLPVLEKLELKIGWNEIDDEGLCNVVKGLKGIKSLKSLYIDCMACYLTEKGLKSMGEELKEFGPLEELAMEFVWCQKVRKEFLKEFEEEMKTVKNFKKVYIAGNN